MAQMNGTDTPDAATEHAHHGRQQLLPQRAYEMELCAQADSMSFNDGGFDCSFSLGQVVEPEYGDAALHNSFDLASSHSRSSEPLYALGRAPSSCGSVPNMELPLSGQVHPTVAASAASGPALLHRQSSQNASVDMPQPHCPQSMGYTNSMLLPSRSSQSSLYGMRQPPTYGGNVVISNRAKDLPEEISTIFVAGFPDNIREREFTNYFTFAGGFEAASLTYPTLPNSCDDPLSTRNRSDQIIGFAKFRTRGEALAARDVLNGRLVDSERGSVLKTNMAKKNLHVKSTFRSMSPPPRPQSERYVPVPQDARNLPLFIPKGLPSYGHGPQPVAPPLLSSSLGEASALAAQPRNGSVNMTMPSLGRTSSPLAGSMSSGNSRAASPGYLTQWDVEASSPGVLSPTIDIADPLTDMGQRLGPGQRHPSFQQESTFDLVPGAGGGAL